jgi:NADH-quinone oxidoreductase subunit N
VLVCSRHFVSLFLGLETLSVSLYGLLAYSRRRKAVEAGLKYLVLAAASSAFMLLGGALGYNATGSLDLAAIGTAASDLVASGGASPLWLTAGAVLVLVGIGFKLAVVPFHMWTPDVYEGAPAPAAALVASLSKGAVLALAVRLALLLGLHDHPAVVSLVMVVALASMTVGNLLALLQPNLKRLLAYSSIAHMGYALVALLVAGRAGAEAVSFYLVTYLVSILAAFAVIAARSGSDGSNDIVESNHIDDVDQLEAYRGLLWRRPWLAATLAVAMVSLAGLPLTAGFMGKVVVVAAGAGAGLWMPLLVLVLNSVLGLYYYLRVVVVMAAPADEQSPARRTAEARLGLPELTCTALLVILIVGVGLFPGGLMQVVARASGAVAPGPAAPGTAAVVRPVQIEAAQGG